MNYIKPTSYRIALVQYCIFTILISIYTFGCAKKSEQNSNSENQNSVTKPQSTSLVTKLNSESRLKMKVINSDSFNEYLIKIQNDRKNKELKYFYQNGELFEINENKFNASKPICAIGLFKRRTTNYNESIYFKYVSETDNKLTAVNTEITVGISCYVMNAKEYRYQLEDLNSAFLNILEFSIENIPNLNNNSNSNIVCGDNSLLISLEQMIQDCNQTKISSNGSVWKLVSRSKSSLETWQSPSGNLWTANLGRNSLIQELTEETSLCKNNSINTWGLVNIAQGEKPYQFKLPSYFQYKQAINEGINEIVQDNNTLEMNGTSQHIYWMIPEDQKYYVYKFFKNSIDEYKWLDKQWNVRCIGSHTTNNDSDDGYKQKDPKKVPISSLPTKQISFNTLDNLKIISSNLKRSFQLGKLIKDQELDKTKPYCKFTSTIELSKDLRFSLFFNSESISSNSSKFEMSSLNNRVTILCFKPKAEAFNAIDLEGIFSSYFEVIIPYISEN